MGEVTLYSTPTCPYCTKAKKYLEDKDVPFNEVNVALDKDGLREMREKSKQIGVPVLDVDGKIIIGFNRNKIDTALEESNG